MERNTKEDLHCTPSVHTMYRSPLGQKNSSNVATHFPDVLRWQLGQQLAMLSVSTNWRDRSNHNQVKLQYWPLTGPLRILGCPDASHRNNDDGSSQRGMSVFLAESRDRSSTNGMAYGSQI